MYREMFYICSDSAPLRTHAKSHDLFLRSKMWTAASIFGSRQRLPDLATDQLLAPGRLLKKNPRVKRVDEILPRNGQGFVA